MQCQFAVATPRTILHSENGLGVPAADGSRSFDAYNMVLRGIFDVDDGLILSLHIIGVDPGRERFDISGVLPERNHGRLDWKSLVTPEIHLAGSYIPSFLNRFRCWS